MQTAVSAKGTLVAAPTAEPVQVEPYTAEAQPYRGPSLGNEAVVVVSTPAYDPEAAQYVVTGREAFLLEGYRLGRIVRVFAFIDGCFILLYALFFIVFFVILPFPILGYLSAKRYNVCYANAYAAFMLVSMIGRVVAMVYDPSVLVISLISLLIQLWIFRYLWRFIVFLRQLTPDDILYLVDSPTIKDLERTACC